MKALSILQPWAWLIVRPDIADPALRARAYGAGIKDIENRTWSTSYRGRILIHAGKSYTAAQHADDVPYFDESYGIRLPRYQDIPRGGIMGEATLVSCTRDASSRWAVDDSWHWRIENARARPWVPWRGQLGLFEVDEAALEQLSNRIDLLTQDPT